MAAKVSPLLSYVFLFLSLIILFQSKLAAAEMPPSSPFGFIKPLQGSKKGDKVKGLYDLKKYLKRFGYIDDLSYSSSSRKADYFSDQLESAVRTYQTNFNLNSTGVLDAATVSQMMMPRCGMPDIINGTNWMLRRPGPFEAVPDFAFFPGRSKWPDNKRFLKYGFANGTPPKFFVPVKTAFNDWHNVGHYFEFQRTIFRDADLTFQLLAGDHGDEDPFDGPGGIFAHSTEPTGGICHFDSDENWVETGPPRNGLDIQSVAVHEIGHLLGLFHSSFQEAIMWPIFSYGQKKRELINDDTYGLKTLYHF